MKAQMARRIIREMDDFIDDYANHHTECPRLNETPRDCTCGFDKGLEAIDAAKTRGGF